MKIEKVTIKDAKQLLEIYAPYVENTAVSFEYEVPGIQEFEDRIRAISSEYPYLKATVGDEIWGYAYAGRFKARRAYDYSVETTIYIRQDRRGQGIGKALYGALEVSLMDMGILNMNACIAVPGTKDEHLTNDSRYFHEKMGFSLVGTFHNSGYKFHTWYDMIWMEKMLGEHKAEPDKVRLGEWKIAWETGKTKETISYCRRAYWQRQV